MGVFSIDKINHSIVDQCIQTIPEKFRKIALSLNDMNKTTIENYKITNIKNYQLDLIQPYESLLENVELETQAKIRTALENKLIITRTISTEEFIGFYKSAPHRSGGTLTKANEVVLTPLINTLTRFNLAEVHGVYNQNGELCAVSFFLIYLNRLSVMLIATNEKGRNTFADYFLINEFIRSSSNKNVTLDFPQNAKENWLELIVGFGATQTLTSHLTRNNLPFFYKLME